MYRKLLLAMLLAIALSQLMAPAAFAAGSCPPGFTLVPAMHHADHHHQHVGTSADQNGDGSICVKHITPNQMIHVHVDNNLP